MAIKHSTVGVTPDEPGAEINKAEWNADHVIDDGSFTIAKTTGLQTALDAKSATGHTHALATGATDVTISATNLNILDDATDTVLHYHSSDRARANHTGTQLKATISDFTHTHPLSEVSDVTMTATNLNTLDDATDSTLHYHNADRSRANHTGTQLLSTISDVSITSTNLNILDDATNTVLHYHDADRARANHTGTQLKSTISDFSHTHPKTEIDDTGTWETTEIPNLDAGKITTGQFTMPRLASGTPDGTKFIRDDGTLQVPAGSGESNTSSNALADTATIKGLAKTKVGVDLPFKVIEAGANISFTTDADKVTIIGSAGGSGTDWVLKVPTGNKSIPANNSMIIGDKYVLGSTITLTIAGGADITVY